MTPCDVWPDPDRALYFVLFPTNTPQTGGTRVEIHVGFAVEIDTSTVVAAGLLRTEAAAEGWMVQNIGSTGGGEARILDSWA